MEGLELIPLLIQMMDKAAAHQVTEAASLANLIAKLITAGHDIHGMCVVTIAVVVLILVVVCVVVVTVAVVVLILINVKNLSV